MNSAQMWMIILGVLVVVLFLIPMIATRFLRDVEKGEIRIVSWLQGSKVIYRGPCKSKEIPLLTVGATIPSMAINVDLDITDQTCDRDEEDKPKPIKVQVLASAIVSVGESDAMILTAANRFFSKNLNEQMNTLSDLLSSSGRRAINLLTHDQLFSARSAHRDGDAELGTKAEEDDPLSLIIRKACSRELEDLGLVFNSLNIKAVQSEVAEAMRRQSAAIAKAEADIVAAQQQRRSREAQLEAEREISNKQRELAQVQAENAAKIANAEALRQDAEAGRRASELKATNIAEATAQAEQVKIAALAAAEAEAIRITRVAEAQAEGIRRVNQALHDGGEAYLRFRQIELLPDIAPGVGEALAKARMVTIAGGSTGAPEATLNQIGQLLQVALAAQIIPTLGSSGGGHDGDAPARPAAPAVAVPTR